jgi:D-alanyl-D-alanine carboxypeptidase
MVRAVATPAEPSMTLRFVFLLGLWIGLAACRTRTEPVTGTLQAALDRQLAVNAERHGIPGQAVLIVRNGEVLYRGSHGLADRETGQPVRPEDIFPVFSVSKLFASILIMQLVERGEVALDEPAHRYLPDLPERWRAIRVDEFLNHVSGVPEYFEADPFPKAIPPTQDVAFRAIADKPLQFATGTTTRYTQTNFLVLGRILEARYGMPYRQVVDERIIKPLGLQHTYLGKSHVPQGKMVSSYRGENGKLIADPVIDWPEYGNVHAGLSSTVDDLGAFLKAVWDGRLVKRETLLRLWKPYRHRDGGTGWFASGWDYETSGRYKQVGHDGGNKVRARLIFDEALGEATVIIYLTNGSATNVWTRTLTDSVSAILKRYEARGAPDKS